MDLQVYWPLFRDNDDSDGSVIAPRSVLRMRFEREEVPFYGVRFKSKSQRHQASDKCVVRVTAQPGVKKLLNQLGITKSITQARSSPIEENTVDLEFLVSRWSTEKHTFAASVENKIVIK